MHRVEATSEFLSWLDSLRDLAARARIQVRIDRLVHGNPGQHRRLGVSVVLLLAGGDKSSQDRDIVKAARLAKALNE